MAKRRLNRPVLIIVLAAVVLLSAGGIVVIWKVMPKDPGPHIARAQELEVKAASLAELVKAAESYEKAFSYDKRPDKKEEWGIRAGDIYWAVGREDKAAGYYNAVSKLPGNSARGQERLVRLQYYFVMLGMDARGLIDPGNALIQMAPDNPFGYIAAAHGMIMANGPRQRIEALALLEKARQLDPNNPLPYYLAAFTLLQPQANPTMPRQDPEAADKLMEYMPPEAPAAVASRFYLYKVRYLKDRLATTLPEGLGSDARMAKLEATEKQRRELIRKITDASGNKMWSINVAVGDEDELYVDDPVALRPYEDIYE